MVDPATLGLPDPIIGVPRGSDVEWVSHSHIGRVGPGSDVSLPPLIEQVGVNGIDPVDLSKLHKHVRALGPDVGSLKVNSTRQLSFDGEVPLLNLGYAALFALHRNRVVTQICGVIGIRAEWYTPTRIGIVERSIQDI